MFVSLLLFKGSGAGASTTIREQRTAVSTFSWIYPPGFLPLYLGIPFLVVQVFARTHVYMLPICGPGFSKIALTWALNLIWALLLVPIVRLGLLLV